MIYFWRIYHKITLIFPITIKLTAQNKFPSLIFCLGLQYIKHVFYITQLIRNYNLF